MSNVLSVLTSQMAAHPQRVFSFIKREGITHIQFIPCLPGLDDEHDAFSLGRGSSRPSIVACSTCGGASWEPGAM